MAFKRPKDVEWYSLYHWVDVPVMTEKLDTVPEKEPKAVKKQPAPVVARKKDDKENLPVNEEPEEENKDNQPPQEESAPVEVVPEHYQEELPNLPEPAQKPVPDPQQLLPAKTVKIPSEGEHQKFCLKPDPIMRLKKVLGFTPSTCKRISFDFHAKSCNDLLYACQGLLIHLNIESNTQQFCTQPANIAKVFSTSNYIITVSDQQSVTVYSSDPVLASPSTAIVSFTPPLIVITSIALSMSEAFLLIIGKDQQKRDSIIVYDMNLIKSQKKLQIEAKQLSDFDLWQAKWSPDTPTAFVTCGMESVRFWKIKKGVIPGKNAIFTHPIRGKKFVSINYIKEEEKGSQVIALTECGLIFKIRTNNRNIESIINISGVSPGDTATELPPFTNMEIAPNALLFATSQGSTVKLWSLLNYTQVMTHTMGGAVTSIGFSANSDSAKLAIADQKGNIGILKLQEQIFETLVRSHTAPLVDCDYSKPLKQWVTGARDSTIRIWNSADLMQCSEFEVANDTMVCICCNPKDPHCACGYSSGVLRIFDLVQYQILQNTTKSGAAKIAADPLKSVRYSPDGGFLAAVDSKGKIYIIDSRNNRYDVFKILETQHMNYMDMAFSYEGDLFAFIGSNANTVCMWETVNFTLKYQLDLPGEVVSRIAFSPNCLDFLLLTATSKLKYFRINPQKNQCMQILDVPGIHELECLHFAISYNSSYLLTCGRDSLIKVFDYGMRGDIFPAYQAFCGLQGVPSKLVLDSPEDTAVMCISQENNFAYVWECYAGGVACNPPGDLLKLKPELAEETKVREDPTGKGKATSCLAPETLEPMPTAPVPLPLNTKIAESKNSQTEEEQKLITMPADPQSTIKEYVMEDPNKEFSLKGKTLSVKYIFGVSGRNNIVWNPVPPSNYLAYTTSNKVLVEILSSESESRVQIPLTFGSDKIEGLATSPNKKYLAAYSRQSIYSGSNSIYIIGTDTWKTLSHITITHPTVEAVEFSPNSNILLVLALNHDKTESTILIYDPVAPELLLRSPLIYLITNAFWNPYTTSEMEFVLSSPEKFEFWRLTPELTLQYQEGKQMAESTKTAITACAFSEPLLGLGTLLLAVAKENGNVDLIDTRSNSPIGVLKLGDKLKESSKIRNILWKRERIILSTDDNAIYFIALNSQE